MEESKKVSLELYQILNKKLGEETHEMYLIHSAYLITNAALIAFVANSRRIMLSILVAILGVIVSHFWSFSIRRARGWREYWFQEAIKEEERLGVNVRILRNADERGKSLKEATISQYFQRLAFIFIIVWVVVLALYLRKIICCY